MKIYTKFVFIVIIILLIIIGICLYRYFDIKKIEKNENFDLIINKNRIGKLSGPVSFTILTPNLDVFETLKKEYNIELPIVILVGDHHYSSEGQCDYCDNNNCYSIFSEKFIKILDDLYNDGFTVDIYTELNISPEMRNYLIKEDSEKVENILNSLKNHIQINHKNEMLQMLARNIYGCYIKELKNTPIYDKYCPSKNIRWHYADLRQNINIFGKYSMEAKLSLLLNIVMNPSYDYNLDDPYYTYIRLNILQDDKLNFVLLKNNLDDFKLKILTLKQLDMEPIIKSFFNLSTSITIDTFIDNLIDLNNPEFVNNSLIYKQIKNLPNDIQNIFIKTMKIYINDTLKNNISRNKIKKIGFEFLAALLFLIGKYDSINQYDLDKFLYFFYDKVNEQYYLKNDVKINIRRIVIPTTIYLLDFYFITRFIKTQNYSPYYGLTIGIFGEAHVNFISNYLIKTLGWYTTERQIKKIDANGNDLPFVINKRCINIGLDTNLTYLLNYYRRLSQLMEGEIGNLN